MGNHKKPGIEFLKPNQIEFLGKAVNENTDATDLKEVMGLDLSILGRVPTLLITEGENMCFRFSIFNNDRRH